MNWDIVIVSMIVAAAFAYVVLYFIRKSRHLSKNIGPCGHCCDNCPFAKYNQGMACCHTKPESLVDKK